MMTEPIPTPIDYLIVGHVARDLTPDGPVLGGTLAYAGRTANALGLRVGGITSGGEDFDLSPLDTIELIHIPSKHSTTFENLYTIGGRIQTLHSLASYLETSALPAQWLRTPIVHLGPIAAEIDPAMVSHFPESLVGLTPQGWLRKWDQGGHVSLEKWDNLIEVLPFADVVVLSLDDLQGDANAGREMAGYCKILAVTDGPRGANIFWNGQERHFTAPNVEEIDPTGSGDIFAAAFLVHYYQTQDPWESARTANYLAAVSVTRRGIASTPTTQEIQTAKQKVAP